MQQLNSWLPTQMDTEDAKTCFSTFMTAFEEALWQHRSANGSYVVSHQPLFLLWISGLLLPMTSRQPLLLQVPLCHILPQLPDVVKEESKQHIISKVSRPVSSYMATRGCSCHLMACSLPCSCRC